MPSFSDLYSEYATDVYRFAFWLAGDAMEAEDITAETFVRAWLRFHAIRMQTMKGYLLKIARNVFLARHRQTGRSVHLEDEFPDVEPGPERQVESRLAIESVNRFLSTLPECERTAFILRVEYSLPYVEIARVLEISEVAARVKVHRTRKRLLLVEIAEV
jgi:RNA polymerase sigma-70 factor (ECF subfamily)